MSNGISAFSDKSSRMFSGPSDVIVSDRAYNLLIGAVIVYGVLANTLIVNYFAPVFVNMNPIALIIGYFILCIAGTLITYRSKNPLMSFIGYNLVVLPVGAVLAVCLQGYDAGVVFQAFLLTTVVTLIMMLVSSAFPGTFAGMGRMLFAALIGLVIAELVCTLLGIYPTIISFIAAAIFSLYIGYDWVKAQMYVKTVDNAVDSALDIYLDIINLFLQLLSILGRRDD